MDDSARSAGTISHFLYRLEPFAAVCVLHTVDNSKVSALLARQDGVISAGQALACGLTRSAIDRRLSSKAWRRLMPGVYLAADRPESPSVRLRSAVLSAGPRACAYGPSAAWWHGLLDRSPERTWVTIPRGRKVVAVPSRHVRRRTLAWTDTNTVRNLLVTSIPLSVLEAAVLIPSGARMLDRAIQRHTSLPILQRAHDAHRGRSGSTAADALLTSAGVGGDSEAERMLVRLMRSGELTGWTLHVRSCGYEIDAAFKKEMVAIEVDGWAWHRDADRFQGDALRQNVLANAGWHVLRFTWHRIRDDPSGVLGEIREALASRSSGK